MDIGRCRSSIIDSLQILYYSVLGRISLFSPLRRTKFKYSVYRTLLFTAIQTPILCHWGYKKKLRYSLWWSRHCTTAIIVWPYTVYSTVYSPVRVCTSLSPQSVVPKTEVSCFYTLHIPWLLTCSSLYLFYRYRLHNTVCCSKDWVYIRSIDSINGRKL